MNAEELCKKMQEQKVQPPNSYIIYSNNHVRI